MKKTAIQWIKAAASKLYQNKLKRLSGKEISAILENMMEMLSLNNKEEAILVTALFDRSCGGRNSDLDDLTSYFECSMMEIMEYVPALQSLIQKGYVIQTNPNECRLAMKEFIISNYITDCILNNEKPDCQQASLMKKVFDRYDFCKQVDNEINTNGVNTEVLFQFINLLEKEHADLTLVQNLKKILPDLSSRALFYEVCFDYYDNDGNGTSDINTTLTNMYESYGTRFQERKALLNGTHPLLKANLVEIENNMEELFLSITGQRLFLEEDFGAFGNTYTNLDYYSFAKEVTSLIRNNQFKDQFGKLSYKITEIEAANPQITSLKKIQTFIPNMQTRALFYLLCNACTEGESFSLARELNALFPSKERNTHLKLFKNEQHQLQRLDLAEIQAESSLFGEYTCLQLTDKGKMLYFEEDAHLFIENLNQKNLIEHNSITKKCLYFSPKEKQQLELIAHSLLETNYQTLIKKLETKGLSKGISILLYGAPGTGKTESVMQWARQSGRDIMHVDISSSKSMWYGESEKNIKSIFTNYKKLCKKSDKKPILLFNEADAIFSKRHSLEHRQSTDQTENTIQNILLEEMERLDGILIATTNLADNLDKAFERRFLFKVQLSKPCIEARRSIWLDKFSSLQPDDATYLANHYCLSGGEIENIVRKAVLMEILNGTVPSLQEIEKLCLEEKIRETPLKIGFV